MITKEYLQQELTKRIKGYKPGVETSTDNIIAEMKSILVLVDALPDYEKKYNEALKRAKAVMDVAANQDEAKGIATTIFPELRESEEEMTRKKAIAILKQQRDYWSYDGPIDKFPPATPRKDLVDAIDVALSYLEKQKEHKPAEWSDEDEKVLSQAIETLEHENYSILANKLKSLRPKPHSWSKEDRRMLDIIISELEQEGENVNVPGLYHLEIDFLKSIRPSWKPSEEQMKAIESCFCEFGEGCPDEDGLRSLYNDLKKLM